MITGDVEIDGLDSSRKIIDAINNSAHKDQLRVIMLDGVTFGGFNIVDMPEINRKTGLPVIAVVRERPDLESIKRALKRFDDFELRWKLIQNAGAVESLKVRNPKTGKVKKIWFQCSGIEPDTAKRVIRISSTRSFIPEPLRVAHLIGYGIGGCK